ncbi:MAG TPA: adenylate/guanylate cyclase domain-containing protein, partial [Gemmatimonadaceae bacterium]|nr:adenylate/guanylate cyclase domain-containing protein [Gemmatimonadaceae bacterium]
VPGVEVQLHSGQTISVGEQRDFVLVFQEPPRAVPVPEESTLAAPSRAVVTVLVGDIRDYTVLARRSPSPEVQRSVGRVFQILTDRVASEGGTVKEFQGDALVAFWEGTLAGGQAAAACRTALDLDALARRLADDRTIWAVPDFPLQIDWALASGPVLIDSFGGQRPAGLSMMGEAPVLAFRIEKFACDATGRILVCPTTRAMAGPGFSFRDLGLMQAKGFEQPDHVFALERAGLTPSRQGGVR